MAAPAPFAAVFLYEVDPAAATAFVAEYGPDGRWAQFFRRGAGYLGTELWRAAATPGAAEAAAPRPAPPPPAAPRPAAHDPAARRTAAPQPTAPRNTAPQPAAPAAPTRSLLVDRWASKAAYDDFLRGPRGRVPRPQRRGGASLQR